MSFSNESLAAAALSVLAVVIGSVYLWCSRDDTKRQLSTIRQHCHELEQELAQLRATNQTLERQLTEHKTRYNSMREAWRTSLRIMDRHETTERRRHQLMAIVIDWQLSEPAGTIVLSERKPPIQITVKDLETLQPGQWVNDEIINGYLALLLLRQMSGSEKLRVLFMNTFFYTKLTEINKQNPDGYNYNAVKRWTKPSRLGSGGLPGARSVFEADKVIIPLHLNDEHWACVCVNMKEKRIEYYDSSYDVSRGDNVLENIERYLQDEYEDKIRIKVEDSEGYESEIEWELCSYDEYHADKLRYPQQKNHCDCGVFMLQCCRALCDDVFPSFLQQRNMPMFRKRMMCHIICGDIPL